MRIRLRTGAKTTAIAGSTGGWQLQGGVDDVEFWCLEKKILGGCQCREHPRRAVTILMGRGGFGLINAQVGLIIAFFLPFSPLYPALNSPWLAALIRSSPSQRVHPWRSVPSARPARPWHAWMGSASCGTEACQLHAALPLTAIGGASQIAPARGPTFKHFCLPTGQLIRTTNFLTSRVWRNTSEPISNQHDSRLSTHLHDCPRIAPEHYRSQSWLWESESPALRKKHVSGMPATPWLCCSHRTPSHQPAASGASHRVAS